MKNIKSFDQMFESAGTDIMDYLKSDCRSYEGNAEEAEDLFQHLTSKFPEEDVEFLQKTAYEWTGANLDEFLSGLKDRLTGVKKFVLTNLKPSDEAKEFVKRKVDRYKEFLAGLKVPAELITNAIMAMYDFAEGVPLLNTMDVKYDDQTKTLIIDPNKKGKGLFSGSPING